MEIADVCVRLKRTATMSKSVARKLAFDIAKDMGLNVQSPKDVRIVSDAKGLNALVFKPDPAGGLSIFA